MKTTILNLSVYRNPFDSYLYFSALVNAICSQIKNIPHVLDKTKATNSTVRTSFFNFSDVLHSRERIVLFRSLYRYPSKSEF
jgi:hypothetical protein